MAKHFGRPVVKTAVASYGVRFRTEYAAIKRFVIAGFPDQLSQRASLCTYSYSKSATSAAASPSRPRRRQAAQQMAQEVLPNAKRRRVAPDAPASAPVPEHHREAVAPVLQQPDEADALTEEDLDETASKDADARQAEQVPSQQLPKQLQKLQRLKQAYEQRGVVYISRIPPHMVRTARSVLALTAIHTAPLHIKAASITDQTASRLGKCLFVPARWVLLHDPDKQSVQMDACSTSRHDSIIEAVG